MICLIYDLKFNKIFRFVSDAKFSNSSFTQFS